MFRSSYFATAVALALGLSACANTEEAAVEEAAPAPETTAETASSEPALPAMDSSEYFMQQVGDRVFFAFDRSDLDADAQAVLFAQAEWLGQNPSAGVTVEGHCDERGTREYNLALGERRADAVRDFLVGAGVDAARISTVSYGKERPVAVCSEESCWSQNRRGVTVVSGVPAS